KGGEGSKGSKVSKGSKGSEGSKGSKGSELRNRRQTGSVSKAARLCRPAAVRAPLPNASGLLRRQHRRRTRRI
ncbi:MAG: hypothetical protein ABGY24_10540, partial [bacterium]